MKKKWHKMHNIECEYHKMVHLECQTDWTRIQVNSAVSCVGSPAQVMGSIPSAGKIYFGF